MNSRITFVVVIAQAAGMGCAEEQRPACEETTIKLKDVDDRGALRFSLDEAVTALDEVTAEVEWLGPESRVGSSTNITGTIDLSNDKPISVVAKRNDFESDWVLDCGTRSEVPGKVRLTTADGAFDVTFEGLVANSDERRTLFINAEAKGNSNAGSLSFDPTPVRFALTLWAENSNVKNAEVIAFDRASEKGDDMKVSQSFVRLFTWGSDI
jgi:hypothetical protein